MLYVASSRRLIRSVRRDYGWRARLTFIAIVALLLVVGYILPTVGQAPDHSQILPTPAATWSFSVNPATTSGAAEQGGSYALTGSTTVTSGTPQEVTCNHGSLGSYEGSINFPQPCSGVPNYNWKMVFVPTFATSPGVYSFSFSFSASGANSQGFTFTLTVTQGPTIQSISASPASGYAPLTVHFSASISGGQGPFSYNWQFGDGGSSTASSPTYVYGQPATYNPTLQVTDSDGVSSSTASTEVKVLQNTVVVSISPGAVATVVGTPETFAATVSGGTPPYTLKWTVDNFTTNSQFTTAGGMQFTFTPKVPGVSGVYFVATDSLGAYNTAPYSNLTAVASPGLSAFGTSSTSESTAPAVIQFFATAVGGSGSYSYSWSFGDDTQPSTAQDPSHTYFIPGTYDAKLSVSDTDGGHATETVPITVQSPPPLQAEFTADPIGSTAPLTVDFFGIPSGGAPPYTFEWQFGNQVNSADITYQNPIHTYDGPGVYEVRFTAFDSLGQAASYYSNISVAPSSGFSVGIAANQTSGQFPLSVTFSSTASGATGPVTSYWEFGDGTGASGSAATHVYEQPGDYVARILDVDSIGHTSEANVSIHVEAGPPTLALSTNRPVGPAPLTVDFGSTVTGGTPPYMLDWSFGDGAYGTGVSPSHIFTKPGSYEVGVAVTDAVGRVAYATISVGVLPSPAGVGSVEALVYDGVSGLPVVGANVTFSNMSGVNFTYKEVTGSAGQAIFSGLPTGFSGWLNTTDSLYEPSSIGATKVVSGETTTVTAILSPIPGPLTAKAEAAAMEAYTSTSVQFTGLVRGGTPPYTYSWSFGDGGSSPAENPSHAYSESGIYTATFLVSDSAENVARAQVDITILPGQSSGEPSTTPVSFTAVIVPADVHVTGTYPNTGPWKEVAVATNSAGIPVPGETITFNLPQNSVVLGANTTTDQLGDANVTFRLPASDAAVQASHHAPATGIGTLLTGVNFWDGSELTVGIPEDVTISDVGGGLVKLPASLNSAVSTSSGLTVVPLTNGCSSPFTTHSIISGSDCSSGGGANVIKVACTGLSDIELVTGAAACLGTGVLIAACVLTGVGCVAYATVGEATTDYCVGFLIDEAASVLSHHSAPPTGVILNPGDPSVFTFAQDSADGFCYIAETVGGVGNAVPSAPETTQMGGDGWRAVRYPTAPVSEVSRENSVGSGQVWGVISHPEGGVAVTFHESGLPSGAYWWVAVTNATFATSASSNSSAISFQLPSGTYDYVSNHSWVSGSLYSDVDTSPTPISVGSSPVSETIAFVTASSLDVNFVESGLPSGLSWTVLLSNPAIGDIYNSSSGTDIGFHLVGGTYTATIPSAVGPSSIYVPTHRSMSVSSGSVAVQFSRQTLYSMSITESGLPNGESWAVSLSEGSNAWVNSSSTSTMTFAVTNGTYLACPGSITDVGVEHIPLGGCQSLTVTGRDFTTTVDYASEGIYSLEFDEAGLGAGTTWYVTVTNVTVTSFLGSSTGSLEFSVPNGSYSYVVLPADGLEPSPSVGGLVVSGSDVTTSISYSSGSPSQNTYVVDFIESGLPAGKEWAVAFNGTWDVTAASSLAFRVSPGTYAYLVQSEGSFRVEGFAPTGTITVGGSDVTETLSFEHGTTYSLTFKEGGLAAGTHWCVVVGSLVCSTSSNVQLKHLTPSAYPYLIQSIDGATTILRHGSAYLPAEGTIVLAKSESIKVEYSYPVTFIEAGLPTGTPWEVTFGGHSYTSTSASITVNITNGTHGFRIGGVSGYVRSPVSGHVTVAGRAIVVAIIFTSRDGAMPSGSASLISAALMREDQGDRGD